MTVGFSDDKSALDSQSAQALKSIRDGFLVVERVSQYLSGVSDDDLVAKGYTADEVATLKSAFTDMEELRNTWNGTSVPATARNFFTFAEKLIKFF